MKYKKHKHGRGTRAFDRHKASGRDIGNRKGKPWRFFDDAHLAADPFEPHFRVTMRSHALAGKHLRSVPEPVRATHGKDS